jgi:2-hydroxychromene-2-carboxylate isomerase
LHAIFAASGGLLVSKRPPQRQAYRLVEMQRWALARNIPLVLKPKHHPSNPEIGHRVLLAAIANQQDVRAFVGNALKVLWVNDLNIEDAAVMVAVADKSALDGNALSAQSKNSSMQSQVHALTLEGVQRQVFGPPFFFCENEPFWGQDRLDMLEDLIRSNRAPIPLPNIKGLRSRASGPCTMVSQGPALAQSSAAVNRRSGTSISVAGSWKASLEFQAKPSIRPSLL